MHLEGEKKMKNQKTVLHSLMYQLSAAKKHDATPMAPGTVDQIRKIGSSILPEYKKKLYVHADIWLLVREYRVRSK